MAFWNVNKHGFDTTQLWRAFAKANVLWWMLPLRSSLQLPNYPTILIENPILPFDKSRSVARKSQLPLISSSRTSLSSMLLHNPDRTAAGKCFSWPIGPIFFVFFPNYLWRSRWRSAWVWAVWLNVWRKLEKEKKEMVCSGMRVDEF